MSSPSWEINSPWEHVVEYWDAGLVVEASAFPSGVVLQPAKQAKSESLHHWKALCDTSQRALNTFKGEQVKSLFSRVQFGQF